MAIYDRWHLSHPENHPGWKHKDPAQRLEPCKCGRGKNKLYPTSDHGCAQRWQVRWNVTDPETGKRKQPKRNFALRGGGRDETDPEVYAEAFEAKVISELNEGRYIDPTAGRVQFRVYAVDVIENRTLDEGTRVLMQQRMENHVYPVIGNMELSVLARRPSLIQGLIRNLQKKGLSADYIGVLMAHVYTVFSSAIADEKVARNPTKSKAVRLPPVRKKKVVPWTVDYICAMRDELPEQYAAIVDAGAGLGLRRGEIFGLSPDDIDWLRGIVHVRRQVKRINGKLIFARPKGDKEREVPLPESVKLALSEHVRRFPPREVTLPWKTRDGAPHTALLMFPGPRDACRTDVFHRDHWRPALERAGIVPRPKKGQKRPPAREHGLHALRHYFASLLLADGEDIVAVSEWLGHANVQTTTTIYGHLMPHSRGRMRRIIDAGLRRSAPDVPSISPNQEKPQLIAGTS
ncbi:site-specific integrase [Actinomadura opuntiae]|uniref:site-specific integrase n=1 Tax=Actinomadura sp. OS1-43 TaxID=604315 RepID=UPI00255A7B4B|nr:site-specific integrase [Actinomadura sp. OS1-43]MDL4812721.1 site-specific integrase [Actinomadura sp. OS1-43]